MPRAMRTISQTDRSGGEVKALIIVANPLFCQLPPAHSLHTMSGPLWSSSPSISYHHTISYTGCAVTPCLHSSHIPISLTRTHNSYYSSAVTPLSAHRITTSSHPSPCDSSCLRWNPVANSTSPFIALHKHNPVGCWHVHNPQNPQTDSLKPWHQTLFP